MKKIIKRILLLSILIQTSVSFIYAATDGRFDTVLDKSISPISQNLDGAEASLGVQGVKNFVFQKAMDIVVPLVIIVGLLTAMIGFYKTMFSQAEDAMKDGFKMITYGLLGIVIIVSAKYIGSVLFEDILYSGNITTLSGVTIAQQVYDKIAFPFIKMLIYLVLSVLFISLCFRVFSFITTFDDTIKKKAIGIIIRDIIAMIIVIGSKQIVEAIYGKKAQVLNVNAQNLGDIGSGILADKNIPILYQVMSWVLGISTLIILILIIIQTLQLLLKPDDPDRIKKIKKSLIYIFIGILVIGASYIITNVLIIN
ncbi:hypothetical protein K9M48_05590 [Candidatus Gracilibacteria bacterium]|nr:hypothetical protein [Candidatus Gracilibacteria bacterium]